MLSWLTYRILAYVAAALAVAVLVLSVALWVAGVRIDDVKNQRDAAELRVTKALETIKGQVALLAECDKATKKLEAEGKERQAEAGKAITKAQAEAGRYQQEAKRLRALSVGSTPSGAGCREAVAEARKGLRK